jgi:hypothetical protein
MIVLAICLRLSGRLGASNLATISRQTRSSAFDSVPTVTAGPFPFGLLLASKEDTHAFMYPKVRTPKKKDDYSVLLPNTKR